MKKILIRLSLLFAFFQGLKAQSLEKMTWFNEPQEWEIKDKKTDNECYAPK